MASTEGGDPYGSSWWNESVEGEVGELSTAKSLSGENEPGENPDVSWRNGDCCSAYERKAVGDCADFGSGMAMGAEDEYGCWPSQL